MIRQADAGLCGSCSFSQRVRGRRGQTYSLCQNEDVPIRYPPLPVLACVGYRNAPVDVAAR